MTSSTANQRYYEWIRDPETGVKPTLVFLHGWGGSCRYWRSTAKSLSPWFDCLLYDLPGFGRSTGHIAPSSGSYEMEAYAEDLATFLQELQLETVDLNAHSMGASIATFFVNRYPQRVRRAILTCSGIFEYDKQAFAAFYRFGGYVVKFRYPWFLQVPFLDRLFMARFLHRTIPPVERRNFLEDFLIAHPEAALQTIYTSVSKTAVEVMPQEFAKIRVPTLLIAGEKDIIIPARMGREAAALNDKIEYVEMAGTAHFPMLEDAPTYLKLARTFLGVADS
ncbi:MAG: alpha/beta hydrolase [Chloroflexaceae bacterium]|nr:alpha/beta hydrolase [Chloroflexaceae bacterium]